MGQNDQDNKHNQKLQGVLIADSFTSTFEPITLDDSTPKVLCPLNNVTMLDYSIEYMVGAGVEEIYIFCVRGKDAIESYLREHNYLSNSSGNSNMNGDGDGDGDHHGDEDDHDDHDASDTNNNYTTTSSNRRSSSRTSSYSSIKVEVVVDTSVTDIGGALRELYNMNVVKSDPFILMSGDVITNADIGPAMEEHKRRHQKDNSAIMTALLKRVGGWSVTEVEEPTGAGAGAGSEAQVENGEDNEKVQCKVQVSPLQPLSQDLTVALAPPSQTQQSNANSDTHSRILLYDTSPDSTSIQLPTIFFQQSSPTINIYNNMIDSGLYICSPDVLAKFSDEWDYLQIKTFISNSVAEEEEGLQTKIYAKMLSKCEYAATIHDFRSYHAISQNLLNRWCYPIVPDNLPSGYEKVYRYGVERHMMYIEQKGKTKVGNNVTLRGPGMVGSHTKIDDNCVVKACVIGNECFIGKNVTLTSCHLWEKVVVEENASVQDSILCNGCVIKKGAVVSRGCIIGRDCVIGEGVVLPEFTRITSSSAEDEDDDLFSDDSGTEDDDDNDEEMNKEIGGVVGEDGLGRVWLPTNDEIDDESDDEENSEENDCLEQMKSQSIGYDPTALLQKRMKRQNKDDILMDVVYGLENEEDVDSEGDPHGPPSGLNDDGPVSRIYGRQAGVDVVKELKLICLDYDFSSPIENLRIELNSFKFSQNATFGDCVSGAVLAILERLKLTSEIKPMELVASFKKELELWAELLDKLCFGIEEEVSVIEAIESAATSTGDAKDVLSREPSFRFLLQTLHGKEIVSDEAIISWAETRREGNQDSPVGKLFNQKTTQEFLDWVEKDDDSTSSSSSSDGSGSSSSDSDED